MSNIDNTTSTTNADELTSIQIPANSMIKFDGLMESNQIQSPLNYQNSNVAYRVEKTIDNQTKQAGVVYKKVSLPPAKYQMNQSLESVVSSDEVIVPLSRAEYVKRYRVAESVSAREILTMCRLVFEANKSLNSAEFSDFCNEIGYKDYSSVIRKFVVIGKIQPRLIAHADVLPASWSSIYSLTQIPAQAFENLLHMNRSFKELTVSEVNKLVKQTRDLNKIDEIIKPTMMSSEEKNDKILGSTVLAKVYFTKVPDDLDWHAFEKALLELQANLPVRVQFLSAAKEIFNKRKNKRYEKLKESEAPSPFKPEDWDMGREVSVMSQMPLNDSGEKKVA
jgi:hypothetical protein